MDKNKIIDALAKRLVKANNQGRTGKINSVQAQLLNSEINEEAASHRISPNEVLNRAIEKSAAFTKELEAEGK